MRLTDKQRRAQLNGRVKTPKKAAASRKNGKLGGRPKKNQTAPQGQE